MWKVVHRKGVGVTGDITLKKESQGSTTTFHATHRTEL